MRINHVFGINVDKGTTIAIGAIAVAMVLLASTFLSFPTQGSSSITVISTDSTEALRGTIDAVIKRKLVEGLKPNRLIKEKSPYLLQHAFNPVNWYPWGEEAFEKARKEDKPIFLSIGYSTCYWCHVMEREVFENDSIAALMNKYVVSVKVDREERPDVDRVYMAALGALTGSGGWPMSMFLTPDRKPFFGATYIPPVPKYGRASFPDIITQIHQIWTEERHKILDISFRLEQHLKQTSSPETKLTPVGVLALERGFDSFSKSYDPENTGFGGAPKFPRPVSFNFLFRYYSRTGNKQALAMSLETLKSMYNGGMYDHIGGGFHRYSTDATWHVPHFEKMLYDQAQLAITYLEAYQITHEPFFAHVTRDILQYVSREMMYPAGGFYSAEDAESATALDDPDNKKEGAFYTWSKQEIDAVLSPEEALIVNHYYGVESAGNVRYDPHQEFDGLNILHIVRTLQETAAYAEKKEQEVQDKLVSARAKLFQTRTARPRPHLDDKILVSWNGLMISAYARSYQVLSEPEHLRAAELASAFVFNTMYNSKTKTLLRRYRDGEARYEAHLEDYAFFTQGLIDLYEASLDIQWLQKAIDLTDRQIALFYDAEHGGFYDITGSDKTVLFRTKESYDGAEPTGNSIAILNLLRLSQMTDNERYHEIADKSLQYFGEKMQTTPQGLAQFLVALDFSLSKPKQIIIAGKIEDKHTRAILEEIHSRFIPSKILLLADAGEGQRVLASYLPFVENVTALDGKSTAYICENYACELPTSDIAVISGLLTKGNGRGKKE